MSVPAEDMAFTEFIQHPTASTGRLANVRALRLRRRGADDLVVTTAARAEREGEATELIARLLASMVRRRDGRLLVEQLLSELLPWVRFLPADDRDLLVHEFVDVALAATSIDNVEPVAQLLVEWRHTAEIHASPKALHRASPPAPVDRGGPTPHVAHASTASRR